MNATFTTAVRYIVDIECRSPLRTGGSSRDPKTILRDSRNIPFVQGTSLAGAFRAWMDDPRLFCQNDLRSPLVFSDLRLDDDVSQVLRPRLRIDGKTGTAARQAKFDTAAVPAGTRGRFELVWTGFDNPAAIAELIERYLSALNSGEITLGAQKTNGFGRVAVTARRRLYHMTDPGDLRAWLMGSDVDDAQVVSLSTRMERDILFTVSAYTPSLLVKSVSSRQESKQTKGKSVATSMKEAGRHIIPGSSLKGSIRSQMTRICPNFRYVPRDLEGIFGRPNSSSGGAAGELRFSDAELRDEKVIHNSRIRINRLTGGIIPQNIVFSDSLCTAVSFEIRIPARHKAGCGLLMYALRDLGLGLYELGSGTAVGLGRLQDLRVDVLSPDGEASMACTDSGVTIADPNGLISQWNEALRKKEAL